ncbi:unnamed protein product [Fusarium graminearum]|nr:unnamed protein product [Fusarium graminearum]CAG1968494.1 unnamed protein product [Fusarium graminearum]CAG1982980.1 unnamed protein product [Fusarium graminearum]VTO82456.1 unnamed protein product [Fusarium graminearum]
MAGKDRHKSEELDGEKGKIRNDEGMLKNLEGSRGSPIANNNRAEPCRYQRTRDVSLAKTTQHGPGTMTWTLANFERKRNGGLVRRREVEPGQGPGSL